MNKRFKKVISSVLAAVMTLGVVGVANVSSVFASDTKTYEYIKTPAVNTDNFFTVAGSINAKDTFPTAYTDSGYTVTMADGTTTTVTEAVKMNSSGTISFNVSDNQKADVTVIYSAKGVKDKDTGEITFSDAKLGVKKDGTALSDVYLTNGDAMVTKPMSFTEAGKYTLYRNATEFSIYYVRVDITSTGEAVSGKITLTQENESNGTTTVTVDGEALVSGNTYDAGKTVNITAVPESGYEAVVTVGSSEVELVDNSYSFSVNGDKDITVTYNKKAVVKTVDTAIGKVDLVTNLSGSNGDTVTAGTVVADYFVTVGSPNLVVSSNKVTAVALPKNAAGTLKFITTVPLKVSVEFSSTGTSESVVNIKDSKGEKVSEKDGSNSASSNHSTFEVDSLSAGTYEIYNPGNQRATRIYAVTFSTPTNSDVPTIVNEAGAGKVAYVTYKGVEYAIAIIGEDYVGNATKAESFVVTDSKEENNSDEITEVYEKVSFGDTQYTAANLGGGESDYVYGFAVTNEGGENATADILKAASVKYNPSSAN